MKFQDPQWRFRAPGLLPDPTVSGLQYLVKTTTWAQKNPQEIYEEFKARFSPTTPRRSTSTDYAEYDLYHLMRDASKNAALFIESFVLACDDLREAGYNMPGHAAINDVLGRTGAGYRIEDDTLIATAPPINLPEVQEEPDESDEDEYEPGPIQKLDPAAIGLNLWGSLPPPETSTTSSPSLPTPRFYGGGPVPGTPKLKAFLCHSSGDKLAVKKLYAVLESRGYQPWLDEVDLLPGQDWEAEIKRAVRDCHVVIVCLSNSSITKTGFVQKEIKFALDVADKQPDGRIYIIPARLEECPVPDRLQKWHWVNLYEEQGHSKLFASLNRRAQDITK